MNQNTIKQFFKDCINFIGLVGLVYLCYIISGIYHQKILKHQYLNPSTGQTSYFQEPIVFTLFPQLVAIIIGYFHAIFINKQQNNTNSQKHQTKIKIPWTKALLCGLVINFNMYTYNQAVVQASFPAVVMVKSCSLLSVILVGVFCSRVKDKKLKLKGNKVIIGLFACLGIFIFNYFKKTQKDSVDRPINLLSTLFLVASLIGDGFLPDLQAEIKSQYKPTVMEMYLQINKFTFLASFTFTVITGKIFYFIEFFQTHNEIFFDMMVLAVLNASGQIVIYKMIKSYRQHIPSFVIGIRKCLTVVINIIYFGHSINGYQFFAVFFVFFSIMWETYDNYLQKKEKEMETSKSKIPFMKISDEIENRQSENKLENEIEFQIIKDDKIQSNDMFINPQKNKQFLTNLEDEDSNQQIDPQKTQKL